MYTLKSNLSNQIKQLHLTVFAQDAAAELQNTLQEAETTSAGLRKAIDERNSRVKSLGERFQAIYEPHIRLLHDYQTKQTTLGQSARKPATAVTSTGTTGLYPDLHSDTAATSGSYGFSSDGSWQNATSNGHDAVAAPDDAWTTDNGFDAPADDIWGEQSPFTDVGAGAGATANHHHAPAESATKVRELQDQLAGKLVMRTPSVKHEHQVSFDSSDVVNKQTKFRRYQALYAYEAGNEDELSFQAGDIISVPTTHDGEPGWLPGELAGKTGWLPENRVQLLPDAASADAPKEVITRLPVV